MAKLYRFTFEIDDFDTLDSRAQAILIATTCRALVAWNIEWLRPRVHMVPSLYESGVRFKREDDGAENNWQNIPRALRLRHTHCVGLACWRVADLIVRNGVNARPVVSEGYERRPGMGIVQEFHVCVMFPDGQVEDPSRNLGMP